MVEVIKISYRNGAYYVDKPEWDGGAVVAYSDYLAALSRPTVAAQQCGGVEEAAKPIVAVVKALEGVYGFDDDKPVDTRHFGPPNNDFPPLTYGDLRRLVAAIKQEGKA